MRNKKYRYFVGDFETTVYKGQEYTEVWASACVELYTEGVKIFNSISEQFNYFLSLDCDIVCYYHNLKFDGYFWLCYLLVELGYSQAITQHEDKNKNRFLKPTNMRNKSVSYSISGLGQWYKIIIKVNNHIIEFRDSLKLLPFSVKRIGDSFNTKHKKTEIEYTGFRYAGCKISDEEKDYIANDVMVIKEAIEIMFNEGHSKLTIGSCCLSEYKNSIGGGYYKKLFPNLYEIKIGDEFGSKTAGDYINLSYHGGWCYLARGKEKKVFKNGLTIDVNSLYPSMMSSESGNVYPTGHPTFWKGDYIPDEALKPTRYYFIRFRTRFYIYPGKLPFIQIKNTLAYKPTEMLETSDRYNYEDGYYYPEYVDFDGTIKQAIVTMTMAQTDFMLFREHYELVDFEILDGCYFNSAIGIFDAYVDKWREIKMNSKGAKRELAKLFLNGLYGKMASSQNSNFKVAYIKEDKTLGFDTIIASDKTPGYIAVGSAITSYARNFTIRAAQKNYHGKDKPGFIYADTDSLHCDLVPDELGGVRLHDKNFCCWKLESEWDEGYYVRQKTYIEHIIKENGNNVEPRYDIKCAGMPERCKKLFDMSITGKLIDGLTGEELEFAAKQREISDFDIGLEVPGKLLPKRIRGGIILVDTPYKMR